MAKVTIIEKHFLLKLTHCKAVPDVAVIVQLLSYWPRQ